MFPRDGLTKLRTYWLKIFWRWNLDSKPETAIDVRVTPRWWLRLFYFRYRPHSYRRALLLSTVLYEGPVFYEDQDGKLRARFGPDL